MFEWIQKYWMIILNILFWIFIFWLLFVITFVNIENIYQFNFWNIYTVFYFMYVCIWVAWLIGLRFIKFKNNILREEALYTIKSIFFLSLFLIPSFSINHNFIIEHLWESNLYLRSYWKIAFLYFALALIVSPLLKIIKNTQIRDNLILSRKIFWILSFIFFLKHGLEYFALEYIFQTQYHTDISYLEYVYDNMLIRYDALSGAIAWILMLLLWITSNKISIKLFWWKWWKRIQSFVYPAFLISVIHIAFASRFDNFYIFLLLLVVTIRTISYVSGKNEKKQWKTTKYICIPCGYIYDESIGDPDSWIEPGTKFEDIPNDWYCPVCGVWKSDFEPYYEESNTVFWWYLSEVISYTMLTEDVLELSLKLDTEVSVLKWQYAILQLRDFDGEFSRAYSIVEAKNKILTFGIKLKDTGRGWRTLKNMKLWDTIKVKWVYGEFILKNTHNPKVFLATGTWLSPMIHMISEKLISPDNHLFFGVQMKKDLFYMEKISNRENFKTHIYLSKEEISDYNYGRIDISKMEFDINTEFYICGNPWFVSMLQKELIERWYKNIYSEKFN